MDADGTVIAIADGEVVYITGVRHNAVGLDIYIAHPGIGAAVAYHHFADVTVQVGDLVRRGQVLGSVVRPAHSVGRVTGPVNWIPHVHLAICTTWPCDRRLAVDPVPFIKSCLSVAAPGDVVWPVPC